MTRRIVFLLSAAASVTAAASAAAQGTVTGYGFGYPPGQLSTRAEATGGAVAEIDNRSPLNPAALAVGGVGQVYAQYDPERRTVSTSSGAATTTTSRFPNVGFVVPIGRRYVMGVSASMLLDRTWTTQTSRLHTFGTDTATAVETMRSEGGITDIRLGLAYAFTNWLRVGLAAHAYGGSDRVGLRQAFVDSTRYAPVVQSTLLDFGGTAASGGLVVNLLPSLAVALSGRAGGTVRMRSGDTLISSAKIPSRVGGSVSYEGLPGTLVAVRVSRDQWSKMTPLSTTGARAVDATEVDGGIESAGPRVNGRPVMIRVGARRRTLPFLVGTSEVRETSFGGGLGVPLGFSGYAADRIVLDLSALRSNRTGVSGVDEHAYDFSVGLRVRP